MSTLTEQQRLAVESIESNVLVSAGAGSGKTHVLVERYIQILRMKPELKISNLVAVTYTKKAAQEMRTRLKARMEELIAAVSDKEEHERWSACRVDIDSARIGTIHSLCDSILRTFPAEAEIDPQFEVLDDLEGAELKSKSIDKTILEAVKGQAEEYEFLSAYPLEGVRDWLKDFMQSGSQIQEAIGSLGGIGDEDLTNHINKLLARLQTRIMSELLSDSQLNAEMTYLRNNPLNPSDKLEPVRGSLVELDQRLHDESSLSPSEQVAIVRRMLAQINLRLGGKDDAVKLVKEAIRNWRDNCKPRLEKLPDGVCEADASGFQCIRMLISLAHAASSTFSEMKRAHQKLDFNDLVEKTYDLLKRPNSPARQYYNDEIAAILVDEFQDTNRVQSQLIALLAGPETRLFLIGDDKQSIYKFQGADVSTFNRWKRLLSSGDPGNDDMPSVQIAGPRQVQILNKSFRSHTGIVGFVNAVFEELLAGGDEVEPYRASHQPLSPSREDDPNSSRVDVVRIEELTEEEKIDGPSASEIEAKAIASWIEQKVQSRTIIFDKAAGGTRPIRYGDFAVLVQRNGDFAPIEPRLAEMGIPYVTMGGSGFLHQQEVYDLENILRFLWSTQDSQSLFGTLRSPLFGIGDDVIHAAVAGKDPQLWMRIQEASEIAGFEVLQSPVAVLRELLSVAGILPLNKLVQKIVAETRYDIVLMGLPSGRQRARNVWRFVSLAAEHAHMSVAEFCDSLVAMRELNVKESAAPVDSGDSVKLMTIHASKGLEFPAVALPGMGQNASPRLDKCLLHREYGIAFDTTRDRDELKPSLFQLAGLLEKDMTIAEKKRLLYVAMTRARDHLGLFFNDETRRSTESFRSWIESALKPAMKNLEGVDSAIPGAFFAGQLRGNRFFLTVLNNEQILEWQRGLLQAKSGESAQKGDRFMELALLQQLDSGDGKAAGRKESIRVTPSAEASIPPTVFGDYFHKLMERMANRMERPTRQVMTDVAISELGLSHPEIIAAVIQDGENLLDKFFDSPLFELMSSARRRLHENPYAMLSDKGMDIHRTDLLVQDAQGDWHVVDYKTDHLSKSELAEKTREHSDQLRHYVEDIASLTGTSPAAAVYFARLGELVTVNH